MIVDNCVSVQDKWQFSEHLYCNRGNIIDIDIELQQTKWDDHCTIVNRHSTKKPVTTMLTYPWKCTVMHCKHLETTGADDPTL